MVEERRLVLRLAVTHAYSWNPGAESRAEGRTRTTRATGAERQRR